METKPVLQSKVLWFNVISAVLFLAESADVVSVLPAEVTPYIPVVIAMGNIALRFLTSQPVALKITR